MKFPSRREEGYRVIRLPLTSLGKRTLLQRMLGSLGFVFFSFLRALFLPFDAILVSTSPPFAAPGALLVSILRRRPFFYWVMDINPDQAVALGMARPEQWSVRVWQSINRLILRRATRVITLDRFMAERLRNICPGANIAHNPLWPLEAMATSNLRQTEQLRKELGLEQKFVFMYSGNWNRTVSLLPLVQAMQKIPEDIHLLLMGDGFGRREIEDFVEKQPQKTVTLLPFVSLERLPFYLDLAQVHLVLQSHRMSGILHPSKTYNALALGKPVLFIGPEHNFFRDIQNRVDLGWFLEEPVSISLLSETLRNIAANPDDASRKGRAALLYSREHSREELAGSMLEHLGLKNRNGVS